MVLFELKTFSCIFHSKEMFSCDASEKQTLGITLMLPCSGKQYSYLLYL